jgi:biotin transport system permease protein
MGSLYSEQHTWLHAVPAYVKLLCLALLGTGLFFTDQLHMLFIASACCIGVFLSLRKAATKTKPFLIGLVIACALIAAFGI